VDLRRASGYKTGAVAADQLEILDRLGWVRSLFAGWGTRPVVFRPPTDEHTYSLITTNADWTALLRETYSASFIDAINMRSPFLSTLKQEPKRLTERPREYVWLQGESNGGLIRA
jgi:hypothetical protein